MAGIHDAPAIFLGATRRVRPELRRPQASQGPRLARPARALLFHFTPTSCSWLNAVEGFFARLARGRLRLAHACTAVDPPQRAPYFAVAGHSSCSSNQACVL